MWSFLPIWSPFTESHAIPFSSHRYLADTVHHIPMPFLLPSHRELLEHHILTSHHTMYSSKLLRLLFPITSWRSWGGLQTPACRPFPSHLGLTGNPHFWGQMRWHARPWLLSHLRIKICVFSHSSSCYAAFQKHIVFYSPNTLRHGSLSLAKVTEGFARQWELKGLTPNHQCMCRRCSSSLSPALHRLPE